MELDLGNNAYEILNDWHPNAAKEELTAQLTAKRTSGCYQTRFPSTNFKL